MLYEIKRLIKSYGGRAVLDLRDLLMEKGKVIGLLGPNGAGKTTLLEILAFILNPTSGEIFYKNKKVDFNSSMLINLRQKVVLVQQQPILFTTTVFSNVELPLKIRKMEKRKRARIVEELLCIVGMESFRNINAHRLSGGETQRIAIAQAIACSPEVILLDEPTASVDVENRITIERIMREINREKDISVIFTTHDMIQASRLADEIVFLFDGKRAQSIHENIFSGHIKKDEKGQEYCVLQDGLRFNIKAEKSGPVRISINPGAIIITRDSNNNISKENIFKGKLIQLTDEKSRVRALVDIGIPLSVLIPKELIRELDLGLGEDVWITCLPESFEII
ncbi:ATP-binding cassette domain-containing protein [Deltaproteobacteria bacterium]|nr:ATP-binding cassette domain-containing protein [Deltaproteobacteria bacterium]